MSVLTEIKPSRHDRIMDVVQAAGLDVLEWANSPTGASNPKYCYEWAFSDEERKTIVLSLWHEDCEIDANGSIVQRGNIRPLIKQLEGQGSPRARRARRFDELLQDARRLGSLIRVALVDRTDASKRDRPEQETSQAAFRQLDPADWHLDRYDLFTGDYVLRREASPAAALSSALLGHVDGHDAIERSMHESSRLDTPDESARMQMDYVCRVVYSDNGWVRPASAFEEAADSFASSRGFGHEEWLFRDEWTIGGWRYAFLQGVNDSYARLCRDGTPFSLTLFTMDPKQGHRYVARLFGVEVLRPEDAKRAVEEFRSRGWFDIMLAEIAAVGGRADSLGDDELAAQILNLRYRPDRVERLRDMPIAAHDDPVRRIRRYTLCSSTNVSASDAEGITGGREPTTSAYFRNGTEPSWVTPEHGEMQKVLRAELRAEYPGAHVRCEVNGVDLLLETATQRIFFEVKSELCTRRVIREALGQVMEYAYYRDHEDDRMIQLVVVGRSPATESDIAYLAMLKAKFGIPIGYRQVRIDS